jgi:hypothetical protein
MPAHWYAWFLLARPSSFSSTGRVPLRPCKKPSIASISTDTMLLQGHASSSCSQSQALARFRDQRLAEPRELMRAGVSGGVWWMASGEGGWEGGREGGRDDAIHLRHPLCLQHFPAHLLELLALHSVLCNVWLSPSAQRRASRSVFSCAVVLAD